jgi:hypothetical protein
MKNAIRRRVQVILRELSIAARESIKWTLVGAVCFVGMLFLIEGLPRVVAVINTLTSPHVISPGPAQNNASHQFAKSR